MNFINNTASSVSVYWLDYSGARVFYNTLDAGQSYVQSTYATHPWIITDASGTCIGAHVAQTTATTASVG